MLDSPAARAATVLALLGALFGLLVWYGSLGLAPEMWVLPGATHLEENYDAFVGQRVHVTGTVVATDPVVIENAFGSGPGHTFRATVVGLDVDVQEGDRLAVYGVARPDHRIQARNAHTVPRRNYTYTYVVSFLAGAWVLTRLVLGWRVDLRRLAVEPRDRPRSLLGAVGALYRRL